MIEILAVYTNEEFYVRDAICLMYEARYNLACHFAMFPREEPKRERNRLIVWEGDADASDAEMEQALRSINGVDDIDLIGKDG